MLAGATYDGLVALEAAAHGKRLLTLDQRARSTYQRLGLAVIAPGADVALAAALLEEGFPGDPVDRLIYATLNFMARGDPAG